MAQRPPRDPPAKGRVSRIPEADTDPAGGLDEFADRTQVDPPVAIKSEPKKRAPQPPTPPPPPPRREAAPKGAVVSMDFAEEEPLTALDPRVAIGLPIERDDARPALKRDAGNKPKPKPEPPKPEKPLPEIAKELVAAVGPLPPKKAKAPVEKSRRAVPRLPSVYHAPPEDESAFVIESSWIREVIFSFVLVALVVTAVLVLGRKEDELLDQDKVATVTKVVKKKTKPWQDRLRELPPKEEPKVDYAAPLPPVALLPAPPPAAPPPLKPKNDSDREEKIRRRSELHYVAISSTPSGASVTLNGTHRGKTPFIESGLKTLSESDVSISLPGYKPWRGSVAPNPGGHLVVNVRLQRSE
jgi:hypothetical protein